MGTRYTTTPAIAFNSSPPVDDGSQVASNLITWAGVKTKLADPVHTQADSIDSKLVSALDLSARAISGNDTAIASDHWKTLQVTGATTIQLSSAASMGAGYEVGVFNAGAGVVTVTPAGSDTINLVSASVTVPIKGTMILRTNQALTGYNIVAQSNRMDAGTISGITSFAAAGLVDLTNAAAGQVGFPATQNPSAGANVLDDYEEGTWTPSLGGTTTYTLQQGSYTKIGRLVFFTGEITVNVIGTGSTTTISGLPFTAIATHTNSIQVSNTAQCATNVVSITGSINASGSSIILGSRTVASASEASNAIFQNTTVVKIAGCYQTT